MLSLSINIYHWPSLSVVFCVSVISSVAFLLARIHRRPSTTSNPTPHHASSETQPTCYPTVNPLSNFDWKTKEPLKIRPFKPKYNLTMSIQIATVDELIEMDKNYLERITLRESLVEQYPDQVSAADDSAKPAIDEFYIWLVGTYLPTRFPLMFQLQPQNEKSQLLHCSVTGRDYSLEPDTSAIVTLRLMGGLVDDDLLFLLPSEDGDGYKLRAFVTCFPNGFNTAEKLNLKLRDIHKPVPQYKERLEKSMDRYLDRLKTGKFIKRANWTITTTNKLFTASGNHLYEGEAVAQEEINVDTARVRCERQMLHRLPETRAILFSFKTYLYSLPEIKGEGLGEALAEAIDGLKQGNVPGFHFYKRAAVWGESAKAYLRS
ncbi:unnamed protein product [Penicillium salamii]|uniref:Uncharacterized protein n=1 Tax=Penicillium salamii TaxID=1612424 RepID=A0A9W4NZ26_9EURO|nr:unnamed protein product [Penicillium salamii]CAG7950380.1 unnamed protein product [Penicillium salamii]CAG8242118.1 unnamed protein product [Penicillium salamii]CAG8297933.1 unnamed protein product [Penicillium salamii]CAG8336306.1 unnamed protein product [Penicillium salamii]